MSKASKTFVDKTVAKINTPSLSTSEEDMFEQQEQESSDECHGNDADPPPEATQTVFLQSGSPSEVKLEVTEEDIPFVDPLACQTHKKRRHCGFDEATEWELVEWYREHEMFYNKKLRSYRDKARKDRLYRLKAKELGTTADIIITWMESMRTRFVKVDKQFDRASGSAAPVVTERDEWIQNAFAFLRPHIVYHWKATEMECDRFDTELLIDEVERRPAIWDMTYSDYKDRGVKARSWEEIVEIFCSSAESEDKKNTSVILQKKWKNLRDSYVKEFKKLKSLPSGSGSKAGVTYIYFKRLEFLASSVSNKETTNNLEKDTAGETSYDEDVTVKRVENASSLETKKQKLNPADKHFADILEKSLLLRRKEEELQDDEDRLFCLSLCKEMKKVPENRRLMTKIELMNVIQRAQQRYQTVEPTSAHVGTVADGLANEAVINNEAPVDDNFIDPQPLISRSSKCRRVHDDGLLMEIIKQSQQESSDLNPRQTACFTTRNPHALAARQFHSYLATQADQIDPIHWTRYTMDAINQPPLPASEPATRPLGSTRRDGMDVLTLAANHESVLSSLWVSIHLYCMPCATRTLVASDGLR